MEAGVKTSLPAATFNLGSIYLPAVNSPGEQSVFIGLDNLLYLQLNSQLIMRILTIALGALSLVATLLPFIEAPYWWIRIFDFPRLQIAVLCLLSFVLGFFFLRGRWQLKAVWLVLLQVAFLYQLRRIIVYTPLYSTQAKESNHATRDNSFRLLISNIWMKNRQADRFRQLIRQQDPDVVLVTEPDQWWERQLAGLEETFPYHIKQPQDNTYGMILYSRLPLIGQQINFLVEPEVPSFFTRIVLPSKDTVDLYCVHPRPPKPGVPSYERDTEILLVGRKIRQRGRPAIVAGDLNDVAWSGTSRRFKQYSSLADPREGRGLYNTYNVHLPLLRYPLDHVFFSREFGLITLEKLKDIGSDHFPMLVEVSFEPHTSNVQHIPNASEEEREEIRQTIRKGQ